MQLSRSLTNNGNEANQNTAANDKCMNTHCCWAIATAMKRARPVGLSKRVIGVWPQKRGDKDRSKG